MTMVTLSRRAGKSKRSKELGLAAIEKINDPDRIKTTISALMAGRHIHKEELLEAARARLKTIEARAPENVIIPDPDLSDIEGAK